MNVPVLPLLLDIEARRNVRRATLVYYPPRPLLARVLDKLRNWGGRR